MNKPLITIILVLFMSLGAYDALGETSRKAILTEIRGNVEIMKSDSSEWTSAGAGTVLGEKDEVRTGQDAYAVALIDDRGATGKIEIREMTRIRFFSLEIEADTGDKKTWIDCALGTIMVYVNKLRGKSDFKVRTPTATIGVRGTQFEVKVQARSTETREIEKPADGEKTS